MYKHPDEVQCLAICHIPVCDPERWYTIRDIRQFEADSWISLERGTKVILKHGSLKQEARIVQTSFDRFELERDFDIYINEFADEFPDLVGLVTGTYPVIDEELPPTPDTSDVEELDATEVRKLTERNPDNTLSGSMGELGSYLRLDSTSPGVSNASGPSNTSSAKFSAKSEYFSTSETSDLDSDDDDATWSPKRPKVQTPGSSSVQQEPSGKNSKQYVVKDGMVTIGRNGTRISEVMFSDEETWANYTKATRKIMHALFTRQTLATHSLTGMPSPAFKKEITEGKPRLNPLIVDDVVEIVSDKTGANATMIRRSITNLCGDSGKGSRLAKKKKQ